LQLCYHPGMRRVGSWLAVCVLAASTARAADSKDPLERARQLYNQGQFEAALVAADEARRSPDRADAADLIAARAHLERYRASLSADDLTSARDCLRRLNPEKFSPRDRIELLVGLGETLYFDEETGAAAAIFESVLATRGELPVEGRERVLDWWASALDADARPRAEIERRMVYQRVRDRMSEEIAANPASATASYWSAAAARGQGDLQAAWDAAQAGWVRSTLTTDRGSTLRDDLDRLVQRAIVPERARVLGQPPETLLADWERFKAKWAK